uniref:RNA-dependent RNA polymerase n=1 Tax=Grapevine-associated botourmia-like virus 1 TaxID=2814345 RepID=A0A8F5MJA0_9VIRU|nr:MAG: RNA-dependent RNA polymerase [Grapevine-associated botourmia-like virus 1]
MRARSIPRGIALHALSTFSSLLECDGDVRQQARGQLMGQLLSFPLLCLSNYLTFKFSVRRDVPVLINGDDIVFRARPDEVDHWRENVGKSGLVLSAGKTLIHNRFFSLNSCMFDAGRKVTWVPFVRAKALWGSSERECEKISSISSRFYSFAVGYGARRRAYFEHVFLTENAHTILRSRRSVTRGLGIKVSEDVLRSSGFWNRELFYLEKEVEPPLPTFSFVQLRAGDIPKGWTKVSPHWYPPEVIRGKAFRFAMEVVNCAWSNPMISDSDAERKWMQKCDEGCSTWGLSGFVSRSMCRLLRMSRRQLWRYVCMRGNRNVFGRVRFSRGKGVWMSGTAQQCENEESETTCVSNCAVPFGPPAALLSGVRMV